MKLLTSFRYFSIAIISLFTLLSLNTAKITEIISLHEVADYLRVSEVKVEVKTNKPLCALDIDFTVSRPTHPATDPSNFQKHVKLFMTKITEEGLNPVDVMFATTLTEQQLMEPDAKEAIKILNSLATVVGLTARYVGIFAGVDMQEHTAAMLKSFDASFEKSMDVTFEELPEHRGYKPTLRNGILFCNGEKGAPVTKPEVLGAYIKTCGIPYAKIIVVDDTRKHLTDCESYFAEMPGVEFQGFHYVKAARDEQRDCTEEEFIAYLERLINILKPTTVEE